MRRLLAALGVLLVLTAGCGDGTLSPPEIGPPDVDVDTPELRRLKAEAGVADCVAGTGDPVDDGLPEVTLPCLGGGPDVDLAALRGPLVVNLWASWCGPCRTEMPVYQAFAEKYAGRVGVLGIDFNDQRVELAMELVRDTGVTFPLLADPGTELIGKGPYAGRLGLPVLTLVDADGSVVFSQGLPIKSLDQLEDLVEEHLGVRA